MVRRIVVLLILGLLLCSQAFASPVNLPSGIIGKEGLFLKEKISDIVSISGSFLYDNFIRKIKGGGEAGKVSSNFYGGQINLILFNRVDLYAILGGLNNAEIKGNDLGSDWKLEFNDKLMWGLGLSSMIYEWEKAGIQIFGDANYRQARNIGDESLTIDGTKYIPGEYGVVSKTKWQEWQVALGVSKTFKYFIPYLGVKYSDVKASTEVTYSGDTYGSDNVESKNKVGPFIGVTILPIKGVSIDLGGSFVTESAFSAKATVRF